MKELEKITPRSRDFAQWYTNVVQEAKLIQYTDVKGVMIFQPYGWAIWENIRYWLDQGFKKHGIQNVAMPLLIPYTDLIKEKEQLEGFAPEIFLVNSVGGKELQTPLVIRPTSEILFCKYFKNTIQSYKDLPLKVNQWTSVLRAEKSTKPFLRNAEFHWHETHAVFADNTAAEQFTKMFLNLYIRFIEDVLCIPTVSGEKTVGERFAGAEHTYTVETMMWDGQALQSATSHNLGQNFTKAYEIYYQDQQNQIVQPFSTSHGLSTRIIGALIMVHGDDFGLVLPSKIAPVQMKILPVFTQKYPEVGVIAEQLQKQFDKQYRTEIDWTDDGMGAKLAKTEIQGIPLAIVIGPKDLQNQCVTLYRRDLRTKEQCAINDLPEIIQARMLEYDQELFRRAKTHLEQAIVDCANLEELKAALNRQKWARVHFAGSVADEKAIKELTGATPRCIVGESAEIGKCFFTGKPTKQLVIFARAY